jgi:hypothetical protein
MLGFEGNVVKVETCVVCLSYKLFIYTSVKFKS